MTRSALASAALMACVPCFAQTYKVQLFNSDRSPTYVTGLTPAGEVVGYVNAFNGIQYESYGFTYIEGKAQKIQAPHSESNGSTALYAVNSAGVVLGDFSTVSESGHGCFVLRAPDTYTYFGQINNPGLFQYAYGLSETGDIVGSQSNVISSRGYKLSGGTYTYFSAPGQQFTSALGINTAGEIVGKVGSPSTLVYEGFLYDGTSFTFVKYPNAYSTVLSGVNDAGIAAGYYQPTNGSETTNGFTYEGGTFTSVSLPQFQSFQILGINDAGALYGSYLNDNFAGGFVAIPTQPGEEPTTEQIDLKFN